ncbi:MAG: tRNA uridine-5-carboxymethylaminomethyl(34) synthesis GTPase MnmE [Clostridia bacterium]|nr:tRNA uridine-5-carboxymethylaminomethyl(34) synthesis GTPase MnmE [Clostridia bacterium]
MQEEMISAISTAPIASGVAIIRISGQGAFTIAEKMFSGKIAVKEFEPNKMYAGNISAGEITDFGYCVIFKAPKSYTGEDMVEFHCHGGVAITRAVLKKTFQLGCRQAERGEFTKRAFLNGKLSLSSCEGLIDMINAESTAFAKAGYYLYREKLLEKVKNCQNELKYVLALIDANVDYPEEDIESAEIEDIRTRITSVKREIEDLLSRYEGSSKIKNGVKVVICGKPNAGKSSILNAIIGADKAIVTEIAGTTRDVVESSIDINGVRFDFSDTAGIRESDDIVESIGISRSKKVLATADIVVFVLDGSTETEKEDEAIYATVKNSNLIIVKNKSDAAIDAESKIAWDISVSAKTLDGIKELTETIYERSQVDALVTDGEFLTEERHYFALRSALCELDGVLSKLGIMPLDILTVELEEAWPKLGLVSGETVTEAVIDEIFSKFCVGK